MKGYFNMDFKKFLWVIIVLLACAGIGLGFYNLGKQSAEQSAEQKILDAEQKVLDAEQKIQEIAKVLYSI